MKIEGTRFGTIDYKDSDIIEFCEPIIGFASLKLFVLFEHPGANAFYWLQSLKDKDIAFPCIDPLYFKSDYNIKLSEKEISDLKANSIEELRVVVIINIPPNNPKKMTANLQAPIIINSLNHLAKQIILTDSDYPIRYFVFDNVADSKKEND